jgi:Tol biopolymer transport system component
MSSRTYDERDLVAFLDHQAGSGAVPDFVETLLARTARTPQRRALGLLERLIPMDTAVSTGAAFGRRVPVRALLLGTLLVLALIGGALFLVGSRPHVPPPFGPAVNGLVAYVSYAHDTTSTPELAFTQPYGDIVLRDPVSGTERTLVGGPTLDGDPVFSLDGTRIAFVRSESDGQSLYVVPAAGGEAVRLTPVPLDGVRDPAWSPDGRSIAFTSIQDRYSQLWMARADGSGAEPVKLDQRLSVALPHWRPPDGREILLVGSTQPGFMTGAAYQDMWGQPDSATARGVDLYTVHPDGSDLHLLTTATGSGFDLGHAEWAKNGDAIVTQRQLPGTYGYQRVVILAPDGSDVVAIQPTSGIETLAPVTSPDGTRIAYADLTSSENWTLRIADVDGGGPALASDATFRGGAATYRWSPDGTTVIVTHHYWMKTYLVDAKTGKMREAAWQNPGYPTWQRLAE